MIKYVAFLRGITPSNPSMRNENLRTVFQDLGWEEVESFLKPGPAKPVNWKQPLKKHLKIN